uniref:hypothetical protein n=1 Tax=Acetatifactor sp. TaxID=1872090 RepID=UPI004056D24F
MKKKDTVFDYLIQIFMIYGVTILCMCLLTIMFGEKAKEVSTIFSMGAAGIGIETLMQFFFLSVMIATLRFVLFTDGLIKRIPLVVRVMLMFACVIALIVFMVIWFGWFPVNMWKAWVGFFACFIVCAVISTLISYVKEKQENKKMEEALNNLKKGM